MGRAMHAEVIDVANMTVSDARRGANASGQRQRYPSSLRHWLLWTHNLLLFLRHQPVEA